MPKFITRGKGAGRKVIPMSTYSPRQSWTFAQPQFSLDSVHNAEQAVNYIEHKLKNGNLDYKPTPQGRDYYQRQISREEQLQIKRALVSAANKARAQGNSEVADVYKKAYEQMITIKPLAAEKVTGRTSVDARDPKDAKWFITHNKETAIKYADGKQVYQLPNGTYVTKLKSGVVAAPKPVGYKVIWKGRDKAWRSKSFKNREEAIKERDLFNRMDALSQANVAIDYK